MTAAAFVLVLGIAHPTAVAADNCSEPPTVVAAVAPTFPDLPWKARIGADQWVRVTVNNAGDVAEAAMEAEKNPSLGFGNAAVLAAKRWKFAPAPGCESREARIMFRFVMPVTKPEQVGTVFRPPYEIEVSVLAISVDLRSN